MNSQGIKLTIEFCRELAKSKGGECLSIMYLNQTSHLKWKCSIGHIWCAGVSNIKAKGFWCPYCAGNARRSRKVGLVSF